MAPPLVFTATCGVAPSARAPSTEERGVVALVRADGHRAGGFGHALQQHQRIFGLGDPVRTAYRRAQHEAAPILREHARLIAQDRRGVVRLARHARVRIGHGAMRGIGAPLALNADAGVVRIHRAIAIIVIERPHTLLTHPRLQQRAIDRKVFAREQVRRMGQPDDAREELAGNRAVQQAPPFLRERRGMPRRRLEVEPDKRAIRAGLYIQLFDELPLTAN